MTWFTIDTDHHINTDQTWHIELSGDTITYKSVGPQNVVFSVTYADAAQAEIVRDAFLAAGNLAKPVEVFPQPLITDNPPPPPPILVNGDVVIIKRAADKASAYQEAPVIFRQAPTTATPYWVFEAQATGHLIFIWEEITLFKA